MVSHGPHAHRRSPRALRLRPRRLEPGAEAALAAIVKELREHPDMTIDLDRTTDDVAPKDDVKQRLMVKFMTSAE